MSQGWRNNLILLIILGLSGGGLWWADSKETAKERADQESRTISPIRAEAVTTLEFRDNTGETFTIAKENNGWQITGPARLRTNNEAVQGVLEILSKSYEKKITDTLTDASAFGLTSPLARLKVQDASHAERLILVGGTAPASTKKRYLALGEKGPVVMIDDKELTKLLQKNDMLRDKHLAKTQAVDLTSITVKRKSQGDITVTKSNEDRWDLKVPLVDRADDNRLRAWSFALTSSSGTQFRKTTPNGDPDWLIALTTTNGETEQIPIYKTETENLAMRPGEPDGLSLPRYIIEELDKNPMDLVAMRPVASKLEINGMKLEGEGKSLEAEKKDGKWPNPEWSTLEEMLTQDAHRGDAPREGPAWLTITLGTGEQTRSHALHKDEKHTWISPPGRPVSLELTPLQAENLTKAAQTLLNPSETDKSKQK
ncbi:hypothetical protein SIID45300_02512 [Candidatus Magnetaquicoccaceae bacterium FCR-1]|uniref:DUF4340 domain-containing protein n=1 Tax=Candidatus Magnetaquiglobus chichijimensis TaxID=3141448 RepID=A0ABQ0CBB0_9PROT